MSHGDGLKDYRCSSDGALLLLSSEASLFRFTGEAGCCCCCSSFSPRFRRLCRDGQLKRSIRKCGIFLDNLSNTRDILPLTAPLDHSHHRLAAVVFRGRIGLLTAPFLGGSLQNVDIAFNFFRGLFGLPRFFCWGRL